ncbi:MAG: PAS domain-containing protein [Deltaproteobacteria bacterium]|nr:PAS domain-containing protein [Deltaproteobacteria bacterium]
MSRSNGSQRAAETRRTGRRLHDGARKDAALARSAGKEPARRSEPAEKAPGAEASPSPDSLAEVSRLFANTADGVWVSGSRGEILFWNRAAEAMLGYPAEQVVGRLCGEVFGGCDSNGNRICGWPCPIKTLLHGGDLVEHFDMATRTKTGQPLWIDVSCVAVPSRHDDRPPTIVHLFRDVTTSHQIELLVRQQLAQTKLKLTTSEDALPPGELSPRELQVITLMRAGASTAAIAEQLYISKATVRNHIQSIFAKLKVHTRLEAVAYVNRIARQETATRIEAELLPGPRAEATGSADGHHRRARASER